MLTPAPPPPAEPAPKNLDARHFHRSIDTTWRRTSYSGLIRVAETSGVSSEPEVVALDDEVGDLPLLQPSTGPHVPSPMADLPKGAKFGTLVHAVLETADPFAADLAAELEAHVREHSVWWPVDVPAPELAAALVPMHDTPLGPLAADLTLRQIGLRDRLREMDFEFPLAGGDLGATAPEIHLRDVGRLVAEHLPADDPLASYAERLTGDALGNQPLRGYLNGSVDAVLRIPDRVPGGHRYVVVDYKSNWLGDGDGSLTSADYERGPAGRGDAALRLPPAGTAVQRCAASLPALAAARLRPRRHLGGVLYLFVRGMCGVDTPVVDGHRAGVFDWQPPASLIVAMSELLDAGRAAA